MKRFVVAFVLLGSAFGAFLYSTVGNSAFAATGSSVSYSYEPAAVATPLPTVNPSGRQVFSQPVTSTATGSSTSTVPITGTYYDSALGTITLGGFITPGVTDADTTASASGQINITRGVVTSGDLLFGGAWTVTTDVQYTSSFTVGTLQSVETYTGTGTATTSILHLSASGSTLQVTVPSTGKIYTFTVNLTTEMPADFASSVEGMTFLLQ